MKDHTQNVEEQLFPDVYLKNKNCTYLWVNSVKFQNLSLLYANFEGYQNIVNQAADHLLLPNIKLFKKQKAIGN